MAKKSASAKKIPEQKPVTRPESETSIYVNCLGLCGFFTVLYGLPLLHPKIDPVWLTVCAMLATALPIAIYDLFFAEIYKNPASGIGKKHETNGYRIYVKLVGLYVTFAIIAFVYWLFPEYGSYYDRAFKAMRYALYVLAAGAPFYFWYVDSRQEHPEGAYWHLGRLILRGEWDKDTRRYLAEHARNWMVKGFFLPLMFTFVANNVNDLSKVHEDFPFSSAYLWNGGLGAWWSHVTDSFALGPVEWTHRTYEFLYTFLYTVDVAFAAVGYAMTFRILNAHIRSVEPTVFGWVICLVCYPPFWSGLFYNNYFDYSSDTSWGKWLWDYPLFYVPWALAICGCIAAYSWGTLAMGYRFSNLTYRGLITSGPYRFTKHPAYVFKNTSFWLISVPFIGGEPVAVVIRHCLLLFGVNLIYYFRARTEERHLLNYPEYKQYCQWMDEHGWFRFLRRVPCFDWRTSERVNVKAWWRQENGGRA